MNRVRVSIGSGPTSVWVDDEPQRLGPAETVVVAALALFHPSTIGADTLQDVLWDGNAPASARASLKNHLSRIRRRIPGLLDRDHDGYRLAPGVDVVVQQDASRSAGERGTTPLPARICRELPDTDAVQQRRAELARRRRSVDDAQLGRRLTYDDPASTLPQLRDAVERDAFDERAWFRLVAATAAAFGRDAALSVSDEATRALAASGLESGRRLRDLERLVRDGERDLVRLMTDRTVTPPTSVSTAIDRSAMEALSGEVLGFFDEDRPTHVRIHGGTRSGRSALLDRIVVRAGRAGVTVRTVVGLDFDGLPVPVEGTWDPRRRRLLAIDELDRLGEADRRSLASILVTAAIDTSTEQPPLLIVSTGPEPQPVPGLAIDEIATVDVELDLRRHSSRWRSGEPAATSGAMPFELTATERWVLQVLSVSELPIHISDLVDLVPDAGDIVSTLHRSGFVRERYDDRRWSVADGHLRTALLAELSTHEVLEIHHRLAAHPFTADEPLVRARRVARHAVAAVRLDRPDAVDALEHAAVQARSVFDHHAAAALFDRAATEGFPIDPGRALRADVAAGRALLAAGDVAGLDRLEAVVDRSFELGLETAAAAAAHAFCRLGPASTAGEVDERAAALIERVLPRLRDPADRALVEGAATMVHVFAGDAEHCRQLFDRALRSADESGRDDVLAEVLPFAYLARAAPEDLELREELAERLRVTAERLDRSDTRWEALHLRFSNQLQRGDHGFRAAAALLAAAADDSREATRAWEMAYVRAAVAHIDGRLGDAEDEITASLALSGAVGTNRAMAVYGSVLLACRLDEGRVHELAPSIETIADEQPLVLAWQAPLALAAAATGATDRATAAFDRLVEGADRLPRECNYTAALVMLGEAAAALGDPERTTRSIELLAPWSGRWAWTGTCSFGPIDLTLARLAESRGDRHGALRWGASALRSAAAMRAPVMADRAARLVLRQT